MSKAIITSSPLEMINCSDDVTLNTIDDKLNKYKKFFADIDFLNRNMSISFTEPPIDENTLINNIGINLVLPSENKLGQTQEFASSRVEEMLGYGHLPILHFYDVAAMEMNIIFLSSKQKFTIQPHKQIDFPFHGQFPSCYLGDQIFLCGGNRAGKPLNSSFLISLNTKNITQKASMQNERISHCIQPIKNQDIVAMGGSKNTYPLSSCELYRPLTNSWELIQPLNEGKSDFTSIVFSLSVVFTFGGQLQINNVATIEMNDFSRPGEPWRIVKLNLVNSNWGPIRCSNSCAISEEQFLIIGGFDKFARNNTYIFEPRGNALRNGPQLPEGYMIQTHRSPAILFNQEIYCADDKKKIMVLNLSNSEWRIENTAI